MAHNQPKFIITSSGTNEQGNHYCHRDYGTNENAYHYSNRDGSYYYQNPDGSKYYNNGRGYEQYTPRDGSYPSLGENSDQSSESDEENQGCVSPESDREYLYQERLQDVNSDANEGSSSDEGYDVGIFSPELEHEVPQQVGSEVYDDEASGSERQADFVVEISDSSDSGDDDGAAISYDSDRSSDDDEGAYSDDVYGDSDDDYYYSD